MSSTSLMRLPGVVSNRGRRRNVTDDRNESVAALAVLIDEVGACARGELPLPEKEQLRDWLVLLNKVARSGGSND